MITIGDQTFDQMTVIIAGAVAFLVILFLVLLIMVVRRAGQSAENVNYVAGQVGRLAQDVSVLGQGQNQLAGNIQTVSDAQANAQVQVIQTMEMRLSEVQAQMAERLADNALKSARSLSDLQDRMKETLRPSTRLRRISKSCRVMYCHCRIFCRTSSGAGCLARYS